uniref:Uncharacterized protein n=1 Tax=Anguilla anguilla TaxID=7936 RepID=A0A0E9T632_ANGAN
MALLLPPPQVGRHLLPVGFKTKCFGVQWGLTALRYNIKLRL